MALKGSDPGGDPSPEDRKSSTDRVHMGRGAATRAAANNLGIRSHNDELL